MTLSRPHFDQRLLVSVESLRELSVVVPLTGGTEPAVAAAEAARSPAGKHSGRNAAGEG